MHKTSMAEADANNLLAFSPGCNRMIPENKTYKVSSLTIKFREKFA